MSNQDGKLAQDGATDQQGGKKPRRSRRLIEERALLVLQAVLVGLVAGGASVLLNWLLHRGQVLQRQLEGSWQLVLLPALGAVLAVLLVRRGFGDMGGHGVAEVIYSVTRRGGLLRRRTIFSHLVGSLLTLGSGGSAGPEAPVVVSGASLGSAAAGLSGVSERRRVVLVCCGAASGLAAIFNAPVAGIIFVFEAILEEWTPFSMVPVAIASVVGTEVSRLFQGNQLPFAGKNLQVGLHDLAACLGLALLSALVAVLLARGLHWSEKFWKRTRLQDLSRVFIGGLAVGGLGYFLPQVMGEGYHVILDALGGNMAPGLALVLLLLAGKLLATCLTLGSGGIGGVFAPSLVLGSLAGLFYARLLHLVLPQALFAGDDYFALLGMAGVLGALLKAPLTGVFLIVEITGGYQVLVSVLLVTTVSSWLSSYLEPLSIYRRELQERGAHFRTRTDARVLLGLNLTDLLERDCHTVHPEMSLREFVGILKRTHRNYFPVEDTGNGSFLGLVHLDDVREYIFEPRLFDVVVVADIMESEPVTVSPDTLLPEVMQLFETSKAWSLPVVYQGKFLGMISKSRILDFYRRELLAEEN